MANYTSASLMAQSGTPNTEAFTSGTPYTLSFTNRTTAIQPNTGYFTVEANGLKVGMSSDAYDSGPLDKPGTDNLMLSLTSNPTDQNPLTFTFDLSTSGDGTGGSIGVVFTGGAGTSTLTSCEIVNQGSKYKIGDTISVPVFSLNAKSGASGTTDLVFKLKRNNINPQFYRAGVADVSAVLQNFYPPFNTDFGGRVVSGSGLVESSERFSIPIPTLPLNSQQVFTFKPINNIGIGDLTFYCSAHVELKIA
tara:strand:- start:1385 stop:2134 length:750 start_codon:yes stop_codon:yes gene_type:complete